MGSLEPGRTIIYENDGRNVYGRYQGEQERWIVGSAIDSQSVLDFNEWQDMMRIAHSNPTLKSLVDKCINTYRLTKE